MADRERQDVASQFGVLLRQLRLRAGMTQEGLVERSKLGVRTVRGLETGERGDPRVATVRQLADALGLDAADRSAPGPPDQRLPRSLTGDGRSRHSLPTRSLTT